MLGEAEGVEVVAGGLVSLGPEAKARLLSDTPVEHSFEVEATPFARGKFATVRRAFRKDDQSLYAAKYIRKRRRVSPEEVWHEVCILNLSRECPFIVHLYQVFETSLDTVLMLEMAEGGDLQTVLDTNEFLPESLCIHVLRDTLKGLQFLHQHSIAHLDIKPSNVVVTGPLPGGRVKLCDFGLSRHLSDNTEVRELFGTPEYVSPEVISYEPISLAVDCWSVGVLTYVLLSGVSPFGGDTKQETYLNISERSLSFPDLYFHSTSKLAIDFIQNLLHLQPSARLTTEESLQHAWLESEGVAVVNDLLSKSNPPPSPSEPNNNKKDDPPSDPEPVSVIPAEPKCPVPVNRKPRLMKKPDMSKRGKAISILKTP